MSQFLSTVACNCLRRYASALAPPNGVILPLAILKSGRVRFMKIGESDVVQSSHSCPSTRIACGMKHFIK